MKEDNKVVIKNTKIDFTAYYTGNNISEGTRAKEGKIDILAVPTQYANNEYYFAQETIDFIKYCRIFFKENSFDILAEDDIQVRSLHSFDIWMPVIWVAESVLLPLAINAVYDYIKEKMKGREKEPANVDVTFLTRNGEEEKYIHYSGDAKTFKESFEKIDLNKM